MARKAGKNKQSQDSHGTESTRGPGVGGTPAHHPSDSSSPAYSGSQQTISTEKILESLEEAKKLESQLELLRTITKSSSSKRTSSSQGGNDDISTQKIRCMLCDKLSNIILDDPLLSESNDVVNRLWKICFYNRINELRSLITKEKSKAKKRANPLPGESISIKAAEQAKQLVAQYETQYKQFLNEAIKLYQYIIDRYTKELSMPPLSQTVQSQSSQQQSQLSQASTKVAPDDERSLVVISSLYKLNIHLGDLYRYSSQYKLSTNCYLYSSKLAPSTGNPYNQLAVVAQSSSSSASSSSGSSGTAGDNQTVVALYYYARSLLATSIPFETSRSNLVRLFEANSKWMKEHLRDNNTTTISIDMGKEIAPVGLTKKEQKEWLNKLRTTNNRKCLVMLVDLQWMFFKGVSLENNNSDGGGGGGNKGEREKVDLQTLLTKMKSINNTISNLINHSSFSESLLLKLLSIFTFSTITSGNGGKIINTQGFEKKRLMNPSWNKEGIIITNQALVFSFLLDFITLLLQLMLLRGGEAWRKGDSRRWSNPRRRRQGNIIDLLNFKLLPLLWWWKGVVKK